MAKRRKRKKSKAQQEYERVRRNLLQMRRRAEKAGSEYYFDLPETPTQIKKRKKAGRVYAADYKKATTELKKIAKSFKSALDYERKQSATVEFPDASEVIVMNFLDEIKPSKGSGAVYISGYVTSQVEKYGNPAVAKTIMAMNEAGYLIGRAERYNMKYAILYVATFGRYLRENKMVTTDEWLEMEAEFEADSWEVYPEELQ